MNGLMSDPGGILSDPSLATLIDEAELRSVSELFSPRHVQGRQLGYPASAHRQWGPEFVPSGNRMVSPVHREGGVAYPSPTMMSSPVYRQISHYQYPMGTSPVAKMEDGTGTMINSGIRTPSRSRQGSKFGNGIHPSPTLAAALCPSMDPGTSFAIKSASGHVAPCGVPYPEKSTLSGYAMQPTGSALHNCPSGEHALPSHLMQPPPPPPILQNSCEADMEESARVAALSANLGHEIEKNNAHLAAALSHRQAIAQSAAEGHEFSHRQQGGDQGNQMMTGVPLDPGSGDAADGGSLKRSMIPDNKTYAALSAALDTLTSSLTDDGTLPYSTFEKIVRELSGIECLQSMLLYKPNKKKGKGGRQPAKDPRLDPNICPRKAKRIVANRQSAARSKQKQKQHLESVQLQHDTLTIQTLLCTREKEKLEKENSSLSKDVSVLELEIQALSDHIGRVDNLINFLLQERDRLRVQMRMMAAAVMVPR